jgi:hypothetical protein
MGERGFQPGNKLGRGRPRGSRNKSTALAMETLDTHAPSLMRKCISMAMQGDPTAMRLCIERIVPVRKDYPMAMGTIPVATADDLKNAWETLLKKVTKGEMTITEAKGISKLLEGRSAIVQSEGNRSSDSAPTLTINCHEIPQKPHIDESEMKNEKEKEKESSDQ